MFDASKIFGAGIKSVPKDVPLVPLEFRKDDKDITFTLHLRRLPTLESQKVWSRLTKATEQVQQIEDPDDTLKRLLDACQILTRPRGPKKKPVVIEKMEGLTLANFKALVNDHQDYSRMFPEMVENPTLEFPHFVVTVDEKGNSSEVPTILEYVLAQNGGVRLAVLGKLSELVEEETVKQEGKEPASESSSA